MLAVLLGVVTAGFDMVMFGVAGVAMRAVGVMRRLFVIAGLMMPGGFAVMLGRVLVVLGSLVVVLDACVIAHISLPVMSRSPGAVRKSPDDMLTAMRQLCCG
jgi:hypothetical protein